MLSLIEIDRDAWNEHWPNVLHAPLTQSWEYGEAKSRAQRFRPRRFLLQDEKNMPVGLLQILTYSLPLIGGVARINRGPVFFSDTWRTSPSVQQIEQVMAAIKQAARRNRWWVVRMIPEILAQEGLPEILRALRFRKRQTDPCCSAQVSIDRGPADFELAT